MKRIKYIIMVMIATLTVATGCNKNEPQEAPVTPRMFLTKEAPGIYAGAKSVYVFTQTNNQLYINKTTNTYRIVSHSGDEYVQIVLDSQLGRVGSKYTATISNKGADKVTNYDNLELEMLKKDLDNFWLWSEKEGLGILLPNIQ